MPLKAAINSGSWSDPATWFSGSFPGMEDVVASNGFNVVIDQDVTVSRITNALSSAGSAAPTMTGFTTPSGVVSSSGDYDSNRAAWKAFTESTSNYWLSSNVLPPHWLSYEFPTPRIIIAYSWYAPWSSNNNTPRDWTFEGWDGSSWVQLHSVTGNTNRTYISPADIGNTTAYIKYRFYITAIQSTAADKFSNLSTVKFFQPGDYQGTANAGGGFIITGSRNIVCTDSSIGVLGGTANTITFSSSGSSTITGNISPTFSDIAATTIVHSGPGTLTITGSILDDAVTRNSRTQTILFSGTGALNILGTVNALQVKNGIAITNTGTCNIVGNVLGTNAGNAINITANATLNVIGNVQARTAGSTHSGVINVAGGSSAVINITGNLGVQFNTAISNAVTISAPCVLTVTGIVYGSNSSGYCGINTTVASRINVIGAIQAGTVTPGIISTSTTAINLLSGPFISSPYGITPLQVYRMHYIPTSGSYFEFRDNSTNGALSPGATGSRTYLYSPSTVIAAPNQNDVRFGTVYASGSQTGQMRVPLPSQVSIGIPVDNTVGTAVLSANDVISAVWNSSILALTSSNSIGNRLKNVSTPDITANQIIGLI